ncbi:MAG: hypothetical protein ABIY70_25200 [Capsulimonas sp.]|jgi:hypothetical protein|uniref:hypothetical protein n=1 Tax=Capsulimonas sp. TaxID=2494211 RepID=UPI0032635B5A
MASYDAKIGEHVVTITYVMGGTNQIGVKKPSKVKAWALCPISGKRIEEASNSVGEATRAVEASVAKSIEEAETPAEPAQV